MKKKKAVDDVKNSAMEQTGGEKQIYWVDGYGVVTAKSVSEANKKVAKILKKQES